MTEDNNILFSSYCISTLVCLALKKLAEFMTSQEIH